MSCFTLFAASCWLVLAAGSCTSRLSPNASFAERTAAVTLRPADSTDWAYLSSTGVHTACLSSSNQAPDTGHLDFWPIRRVQMGFRVIDRPGTRMNLDSSRGPNQIGDILYTANGLLKDLPRSWLPRDAPPPQTPSRLRLVTAPNPSTAHGYDITFHYDDEVPLHVHTGKAKNIGDGAALARYGRRTDSVLNAVLLPIDPAPPAPLDQPTGIVGVAIGSRYIKLVAPWLEYDHSWRHHRNLIHEVAHVYTVAHTWAQDDGCDDTPRHRPCWNIDEPAGCDSAQLSNNIMDYTANASALTPCQVGRIHAAIAREGSRQRAFVAPDWCDAAGRPPLELRDTFVLRHATDLDRGIVVQPGGHLEVRCRLSIPAGERIAVMPGGSLELAGGRVHNSCGRPWGGIYVGERAGRRGKLVWHEGSSVETDACVRSRQ